MHKLAMIFTLASCLPGCTVHIYFDRDPRPIEPAPAVQQVTPPIPPTLPRPARDDRYRCVTCGEPVVNAVTDGRIMTHHVEPGRDRNHAAKLSKADTQIIVDGLRMRD